MKKIYSFIFMFALVLSATAQKRSDGGPLSIHVSSASPYVQVDASRAAPGDTLMYMPLEETIVNPTDAPGFSIVTEDVDGLTLNQSGDPLDWGVLFSTTDFFMPWEVPGVDSAFFWSASSWFNPVGVANNWLMFGPITIPASGAVIMWYERCNPAYRDGYRVLATTTIATVPFASSDFVDAPFYTRTDEFPSSTEATDTIWVQQSVMVPAGYNGLQTYFAFNHTANDMDQLYIDEITIIEGPVSVNEASAHAITVLQNQPNPAKNYTNISYMLNKPADVSVDVIDVTGRVVMSINEGSKAAGAHHILLDVKTLNAGVYFYTLNANGVTSTNRLVISK